MNGMATPTCETIETHCNKKLSSWHIDFVFMICICVTIHFTSRLHDFIAFINNFYLTLSFQFGLLCILFLCYNFTFLHGNIVYIRRLLHSKYYQYWCMRCNLTSHLKQLTCLTRSHAFYAPILHKPIAHWHSPLLLLTVSLKCIFCDK